MTPLIALMLTTVLIGYLIRRDSAAAPHPSPAIWLPILWLLVNGSRQVSQWLGTGLQIAGQRLHEGSAVDQVFYGLLIVGGIIILANRQGQIGQLARSNWWLILFFLYEGISVLWSDFPLIAGRRWIKASGDIVMILVLWSDPHPVRAITAAIKRSGFVLIPLSMLFCKYYDHMGRVLDDWGRSYYTGVTLDKNMFGYLLYAYGLFFAAAAVHAFRQDWKILRKARTDFAIYALLLAFVAWQTPLANSKTSLFTLGAGILLMLALQLAIVKRNVWAFLIAVLAVGGTANALFSVHSAVLEASGRDASMTGRTGIWETVLNIPNNPVLGTGYSSFWLGERLQRIWEIYPRTPLLQAHNGYIELYINLGIVGVALLAGVLWTALKNARRRLLAGDETTESMDDGIFRTFGMAYILTYLVYNITEATFMGLNFLFIIFIMLAFDFQSTRWPSVSANRGTS